MEGTEARRAADRDRNRPADKVPTAALLTDGLYIPAKDGGLGATESERSHNSGTSRVMQRTIATAPHGYYKRLTFSRLRTVTLHGYYIRLAISRLRTVTMHGCYKRYLYTVTIHGDYIRLAI